MLIFSFLLINSLVEIVKREKRAIQTSSLFIFKLVLSVICFFALIFLPLVYIAFFKDQSKEANIIVVFGFQMHIWSNWLICLSLLFSFLLCGIKLALISFSAIGQSDVPEESELGLSIPETPIEESPELTISVTNGKKEKPIESLFFRILRSLIREIPPRNL